MKHFGNVCNIDGKSVDPVDIITFGAPCQDLSVAGKRSGMRHEVLGDNETTRSGLFFEAIRIIKEMRESTNGEYPKYAVYENVPGAFSSNKGRDFHAVLEALCAVCDDAVSIPKPYDAKRADRLIWDKAGEIVGDNYSVAWRTLDAQYWGVPQRRKRIYLVADFTGRCAGEILFKPDSLRGDLSQGDETGQEVTADAVGSIDGSSGVVGIDGYNFSITGDKSATVGVNCGMSTGRNGVIESVDGSVGNRPVVQEVIALQANGIDRADTAGCNDCGWRENESYTLNTIDRHAVCFEPGAMVRDMGNRIWTEQSPTIRAKMGDNQPAVCYDARNHNAQDISGTIQAKPNGGQSLNYINPVCYDARGNGDGETACTITGDHQNRITDYTAGAVQKSKPPRKYIIRRLTPTECQRLQGFPNIVEVDMTDITRDELVAIALSAGYIKVNIASGEVFATRGPGGMERDTPVLLSGANVNGYKVYSLHANGVKKQIRANRLVWIAAHGAIPDGMVVDHINNDKQDNRVSNLQLLTAGQNSAKAHDDGCYLVGDDNPNCKIKECERKTISFLYWHTNMPYRILAEHFGISHSRAQQIIHEYEWGHLAPYNPTDAEFWESVRKTHAEINGKTYKPTKNIKGWYDKLHNDGAEYKAYGNGLALPNAEFVLHGIAEQGAKTLGSLFDGIGGFPLAGVMNGIKPLWASEVEPYPIAVTKSRFEEVHNA